MTDSGKLTRLSLDLRDKIRAWRGLSRKARDRRQEDRADTLFLRARALAKSGDKQMALSLYQEAVEIDPLFADAIEAQAELLEGEGDGQETARLYTRARQVRGAIRQGMPDRHFAVRQRGRMTGQILAYDSVLRSLKKNALPFLARGNAHLSSGNPAKALADYQKASKLKPGLLEAELLQAEALVRLARYTEAIAQFDRVLLKEPSYASAFGGRAIAWMALGNVGKANSDFEAQARLLEGKCAPSTCVALRRADYAIALSMLDAVRAEDSDPYWELYALTCSIRLGRAKAAPSTVSESWPGPLLALHSGNWESDAVLRMATTSCRRGEALFQLGILSLRHDPSAAKAYFSQVIELVEPEMIEFCAARNELERL